MVVIGTDVVERYFASRAGHRGNEKLHALSIKHGWRS